MVVQALYNNNRGICYPGPYQGQRPTL